MSSSSRPQSTTDHTKINFQRQVLQTEKGPFLWLPLNIPMPDYPADLNSIDDKTWRQLRWHGRTAALRWFEKIDAALENERFPKEMRIMCIMAVTAQLKLDIQLVPIEATNLQIFWAFTRDIIMKDDAVKDIGFEKSVIYKGPKDDKYATVDRPRPGSSDGANRE
ncbi:Fc.00g032240.m01.CDS01 [Cosmosporella sp. VM-42]